MKNLFIIGAFAFLLGQSNAQSVYKIASLNEDDTMEVHEVLLPDPPMAAPSDVSPDPFLSYGQPAYFIKNQRGLALADLDGDGLEDMIFGINDTLYARKGNGDFLFKKKFNKPVLMPVAVADMDNDGFPDIILNYGHSSSQGGGVTLLDREGNEFPGWPVAVGKQMSSALAVSDLDGDGIFEIVSAERTYPTGLLHIFKIDGSSYSSDWPAELATVPAATPSIGDINNDGVKDIVMMSYSEMNAFNLDGTQLDGFPVSEAGVSYSYQSPILVDLDGDDTLEIVGANHGDHSRYFVMKSNGSFMDGWPYNLPGWTYAPPTVADVDDNGSYEIFMGYPSMSFNGEELPAMYGFESDGTLLEGFPIMKEGGNESVVSIADVNNDGVMDLVFGSNMTDADGYGFIHAYAADGSGQVDGFPLRPIGFTYMNGSVLGDVDGDGQLDLTALSYSSFSPSGVDSIYINTYNLGVPYHPDKILRSGYKGNNTRDGLIDKAQMGVSDVFTNQIQIYPNPSNGILNIRLEKEPKDFGLTVLDMTGRKVYFDNGIKNQKLLNYDLSSLPKGVYLIYITADRQSNAVKWIKK